MLEQFTLERIARRKINVSALARERFVAIALPHHPCFTETRAGADDRKPYGWRAIG